MNEQYRKLFTSECVKASEAMLIAINENQPIPNLLSNELLAYIDNHVENEVIGTMNQLVEKRSMIFDFFISFMMDGEIGEILYFHQCEELAEKAFKYLVDKNFTEQISCFEVLVHSSPLAILRYYEISKPYLKKYKVKDDVFSGVVEGGEYDNNVRNYLKYCEQNPELISDETKKNLDGWYFCNNDLTFGSDDFIECYIRAFSSVCENIETVIVGSVINQAIGFYKHNEYKDEPKDKIAMEEEFLPVIVSCFKSLKDRLPSFKTFSDKDFFDIVIYSLNSLISENDKKIEEMEEGYSRTSLQYENRAGKHIKEFLSFCIQ